jgi:hypothetical protein
MASLARPCAEDSACYSGLALVAARFIISASEK